MFCSLAPAGSDPKAPLTRARPVTPDPPVFCTCLMSRMTGGQAPLSLLLSLPRSLIILLSLMISSHCPDPGSPVSRDPPPARLPTAAESLSAVLSRVLVTAQSRRVTCALDNQTLTCFPDGQIFELIFAQTQDMKYLASAIE